MATEPVEEKKQKRPPRYIGVGLALGAGIGVAMGNIAVGVAVGVAIGAGLESYYREKLQNENSDEDEGSS